MHKSLFSSPNRPDLGISGTQASHLLSDKAEKVFENRHSHPHYQPRQSSMRHFDKYSLTPAFTLLFL